MQRRVWTLLEIELLRAAYANNKTVDIAEALKRPVNQVYSKANQLGLKKSDAFLASPASGRLNGTQGSQHRFPKGNAPWNKGTKGLVTGGQETQFRAGQMPHNHLPVGTIVSTTDGYLRIKTAEPNIWHLLHRKVWENVNGPVPKGMVLAFRDGNRQNCALDNLELISRSERMNRNTIHNYPEELKSTIRLVSKLRRKINERQDNR